MTKICSNCSREFVPTSRHLKCPTCRSKDSKVKCASCGNLIFKINNLCKNCLRLKPGKNAHEKRLDLKVFLTRAKRRGKLENLDVDELKRIWEEQKGICIYTKIKLLLPKYTEENDPILTASLDRIDSDLPYTKGNIQFISIAANYMKHKLTHDKMIEFCKLISKSWCE